MFSESMENSQRIRVNDMSRQSVPDSGSGNAERATWRKQSGCVAVAASAVMTTAIEAYCRGPIDAA